MRAAPVASALTTAAAATMVEAVAAATAAAATKEALAALTSWRVALTARANGGVALPAWGRGRRRATAMRAQWRWSPESDSVAACADACALTGYGVYAARTAAEYPRCSLGS